jgi:hypothetical protein
MTGESGVVELRQYTFRSGRLDAFIGHFESLIPAMEQAGHRLLGYFRDLDAPNRFVWLRGFADMETRQHALETFYHCDAWYEHRDAINEGLVDYSNVLLLRPGGDFQPTIGGGWAPGSSCGSMVE